MKVEVLEHEERKLKLRIEESSVGVMNALRRTLMMEVPSLAIEDVTIYDNKSALFDEVVAHRLGLLPIPTDPMLFADWESGREPEDEADEAGTQVLYTLTFEGPGTVYGRDLKPATGEEELEVAEPEVPIVKLGAEQRIMLEATASLGTGADHAKWQPVVAAGYRHAPTVEVDGPLGLDADDQRALEEMAPEGALAFDGDEVEILDEVAAHDILYNAGTRFGLENVTFGHEEEAFIFQFETDGSLTAKQALQQAIKILMEKLDAVADRASELQ